MGRLVDNMARLQEDWRAQVSIISTQRADFELNRVAEAARDARERAMFVVESGLSVRRMLKEFHDSRVAIAKQGRADRSAFMSDMVKKRAEFLSQVSTNGSAGFIADTANSAAVSPAVSKATVSPAVSKATVSPAVSKATVSPVASKAAVSPAGSKAAVSPAAPHKL